MDRREAEIPDIGWLRSTSIGLAPRDDSNASVNGHCLNAAEVTSETEEILPTAGMARFRPLRTRRERPNSEVAALRPPQLAGY